MSDYLDLSPKLRRAVKRNKETLVVELYHSTVDDIFSEPSRAMFRYANTNLVWNNCKYKGKLTESLSFDKFINKEFNTLQLSLLNVKRGAESPSFIVLNTIIKGFRVAVRAICKDLPIEESWIVWSGRLDAVSEISKEVVTIDCTQELGKFTYQVATDFYGQRCPLKFGFGDCLGNQTLEQKSSEYQAAFKLFGYGGCNNTFESCAEKLNQRFYQGQRKITTGGTFNRPTIVKKQKWWAVILFGGLGLFGKKKKVVNVPVQWSPKNQDDNSNLIIPFAFGRVSMPGHPFVSADKGTTISALVGFLKAGQYGIEGFYQVTSGDDASPVTGYTQHLGTLGGIETQQPDPRFLDSGYNSRLAYLGVDVADTSEDPLSDTPQEFPTVSSIIKANIVPVFDGVNWENKWSNNAVWAIRYLMINFPYTVVKAEWFNDFKNLETANRNFRIVEDDTSAEIAVVSNNEIQNFNDGLLTRLHSAARFNSQRLYTPEQLSSINGLKALNPSLVAPLDPTIDPGDIDFFPLLQSEGNTLQKTFLQFAMTLNGIVGETTALADLLYGFFFPTFRGYMSFDRCGEMYIGSRKAAPNAFVREDFLLSTNSELNQIPITNVAKLHNQGGYLLIGVGQAKSEIRQERGVRYIHTPTAVDTQTVGTITLEATDFVARENAPSSATLKFGGVPQAGNKITVSFTTPVIDSDEPYILTWDWYVDADTDTLDIVALMLKARLEANMAFEEFWTCRVNQADNTELIIEYQGGHLILDKPLLYDHLAGEEILRVVEVYENFKDRTNLDGRKDNIHDFVINRGDQQYQSVKGTYISAIEDFTEVQALPQVAWGSVEDERELNELELDLRMIDNDWQASYIIKANYIDFVVGSLYAKLDTVRLAMFHQEDDVIAVQYQTLEGAVTYLPMSILSLQTNADSVSLGIKLYLSAMFDRRIAKEEKRLESSLTQLPATVPVPTASTRGGYSSTRTGDGANDKVQDIIFKPQPYRILPKSFHTDGSMSEVTESVLNYRPIIFGGELNRKGRSESNVLSNTRLNIPIGKDVDDTFGETLEIP